MAIREPAARIAGGTPTLHCGTLFRAKKRGALAVPPASFVSFVGGTIMSKRPDLREFLEVPLITPSPTEQFGVLECVLSSAH
jgi:hypothetical protein